MNVIQGRNDVAKIVSGLSQTLIFWPRCLAAVAEETQFDSGLRVTVRLCHQPLNRSNRRKTAEWRKFPFVVFES